MKIDTDSIAPDASDSDTPHFAENGAAVADVNPFGPSAPLVQGQPHVDMAPSPLPAPGGFLFGPDSGFHTGSVFDPDSGVFEAQGSYSSWEQFSEQAFFDLDDLMNEDGEGAEEMLFGPVGDPLDIIPDQFESGYQGVLDVPEAVTAASYRSLFSQSVIIPPLSRAQAPILSADDDTYDESPPNSTPPASGDDPLFSQQWYLKNTSGGVDINVSKAWEGFTGQGVKVAVCDDGVEYTHPDLAPNYLSDMDYDAGSATGDGKPREADDNHGTSVAGFIGAAKNGYGITGVAYDAGIASLRSGSEPESATVLAKCVDFDVSSNSWTFDPFDTTPGVAASLKSIAENGRGGLGTVTVFCSSNERGEDVMSDYYSINATPYTFSVGAVNSTGKFAYFSSAGPNVLVTAPGEDVISTDRAPANGYDANSYFHSGSGTSFSTPIVSGVVALMLEANSSLGYRDVHSILAYTSVRTTAMVSDDTKPWDWQINDARDWNGGGLHASHDYGFGLVDATAAVRLAESWDHGQHTYSNQFVGVASSTVSQAIPDNTGAMLTSTITTGSDVLVQQALVAVNMSHGDFTQLEISLISPGGISSVLFYHPTYEGLALTVDPSGNTTAQQVIDSMTHTFGDTDTWTFKTVMPFGENAQGDWTLSIRDTVTGEAGTLNSWTLSVYGDITSADDLYVYTDEYSTVSGDDAGRKTLVDSGGVDTINASTVTSDSSVNLASGSTSTIDGVALTISVGTTIENVHTGDGNDTILGNDVNNNLFGWRGNDVISGQGGNDILHGGVGTDALTGGMGSDIFYYGTVLEGGDSITDFNHADDGFNFSYTYYGQSSAGNLAGDHFFTASASVDVSEACFIFESDHLWYDSDGTGATAAIDISYVAGDAVHVDDIVFV
ncbi:MAG: S8 family serine peptidase [Pseudodesulfovibrio sp.]|nr:S8 family serine peptidase [Pseudodesulfovibrio sp.]